MRRALSPRLGRRGGRRGDSRTRTSRGPACAAAVAARRPGRGPACGAAVAALLALLAALALPAALRAQQAADSAFAAGERARADSLYRAYLADHPTSVHALFRLGLLAGWRGDYDEALSRLDRALGLAPDYADVAIARGRVLAWDGRRNAAIDTLRGVVRAHPARSDARTALATVLLWEDRPAEARAALEQTPGTAPSDPAARALWLRAGKQVAMDTRDWVAAERILRQEIRRRPEDASLRVELARILRWEGRAPDALEALEAARRLDPSAGVGEAAWLETSAGEGARLGVSWARDSDENEMTTFSASASAHPVPELGVRVSAARHDHAFEAPAFTLLRQSNEASVGADWTFPLGWKAGASVGAEGFRDAEGGDAVTWGASVATPGRERLQATLSYDRSPLAYTAILLRSRVVERAADLALRWRSPSPWTVQGDLTAAWYRGSVPNHAVRWRASAARPVLPWLDLGADLRGKAFDRAAHDGYFDPQLYVSAGPTAGLSHVEGPVELRLDLQPGLRYLRRSGSAGNWAPSADVTGGAVWHIGPGREASLSATWAKSAGSAFSTGASGYTYYGLSAGLRWTF